MLTMDIEEKTERLVRIAAIRGEKVPVNIKYPANLASLIRGIRRHHAFATSDAVAQICATNPKVARARNARLIMSGVIPENMADDERPYCIWAPDIAPEDTYRQLARLHPAMRYLVGRACAAAGYSVLYSELDLLPDVSIAEEARESSSEGSQLIYESIMGRPTCLYRVLHDCDRSIATEQPEFPAFLNGDTEVRWMLETRWESPYWHLHDGRRQTIEEDYSIELNIQAGDPKSSASLSEAEIKLLHEPLPAHLHTSKTELLIQMAAYDGNIDRYARLRCPLRNVSSEEMLCITRGIYHHTMFARWWHDQIAKKTPRALSLARSAPRSEFK